jgi:SanA protein
MYTATNKLNGSERRVLRFRPAFRLHSFRAYRRLLIIAGLPIVLVIILLVAVRGYSAWQARSREYAVDRVLARPVAIVFGAEVYADGSLSPMLSDRVKAGVELYQAGKVQALLFSGDNHIDSYNEPEAMRRYALNLGMPIDAIVLDYAGFRTYDSCYRARDIFKVKEAILVTQAFHLDRALLICNGLGIDSIGVAADYVRLEGYAADSLLYSQTREFISTTLSVFDLLRGAKPYFLGDPLPIFSDLR